MQSVYSDASCEDCQTSLVDLEDELACPRCGAVTRKEVLEPSGFGGTTSPSLGKQSLGSYLGSISPTAKERSSKGFSKTNSTFAYLKVISDSAGRDDGAAECDRIVERIGEKLSIPSFAIRQATVLARRLLPLRTRIRGVTLAAISAYALDSSCKIAGVTSVSTREILDAHRSLGRRVKMRSLIQLSLDSQVKVRARRPEDCLTKIIAKLAQNARLASQFEKEGVKTSAYLMELRSMAGQVLSQVDEGMKAGHRPSALAATAVYAADQLLVKRDRRERRITQRDVAECGETAEYTVREQYREIFAPSLTNPAAGRSAAPLAQLAR